MCCHLRTRNGTFNRTIINSWKKMFKVNERENVIRVGNPNLLDEITLKKGQLISIATRLVRLDCPKWLKEFGEN